MLGRQSGGLMGGKPTPGPYVPPPPRDYYTAALAVVDEDDQLTARLVQLPAA